ANAAEAARCSTAMAFEAHTDAAALGALALPARKLRGVRVRTASALLHWMRPDRYPILDIHVVNALGETANSDDFESQQFYSHIAGKARSLARRLQLDLRVVDSAL